MGLLEKTEDVRIERLMISVSNYAEYASVGFH
jgi:hypothetical protein